MKRQFLIIAVLIVTITSACKKTDSDSGTTLKGILVLNEGNFGQANASVTSYNPESGEVSQNRYENVNGSPIGDVLYSATEIGDRLYLVVNNSSKIEVVDKETFTKIATIRIANEASPRELVKVSETKAYVTNLFGNSVSVINLETNEEVSTIAVGSNPTKYLAKNLTPSHSLNLLRSAGISDKSKVLPPNQAVSLIDLPRKNKKDIYWIATKNFFSITLNFMMKNLMILIK